MILIFVSSLNENMKLAKNLHAQLEELGKESEIINLVDLDLPMYDSLKEEKDGIPTKVDDLIKKMEGASGYLFVTPEYNFSLPPVLVNTIAWVSRVGDDFRKLFALKTIQLSTHSGAGGTDVVNAMRSQFVRLGSIVMPREIITTYQNPLKPDSSIKILTQFVGLLK
ncbi:NADPH-dependent FMN reductase [Arcobacter sp. LA11]|uniref:NADPH-dependent FMN reductase n=1 Tax=Arcobacter sp. LA11 TaxID=1898176 RepID=UPI0009353940|nr:NAD(P)H-dependent oxidoreductase [Arcobacter sp. LA11]